MERRGFFWRFLEALNPLRYDRLTDRSLKEAFLHVPKTLFLSFIVMSILFIPLLISLPSYIDRTISKTDSFSVNVSYESRSPIRVPEREPIVIFDKKANISSPLESNVLVTSDSLLIKPGLCQLVPASCFVYDFGNRRVERNLGGYSNVLSHKDFYVSLLSAALFLMIPAILIISYAMYLMKYLAIALLFTVLAFAVSRAFRFEISFRDALKVSFYALTLMIAVEIILLPLGVRLFYLHHAIFLIYGVLGILRTGYRDRSPRKKMKRRGGEYVELSARGHE